MELFILGAILVFAGGIIFIFKTGFNEVIKGIESLDNRLMRIEEELKQQKECKK